MMFGADWYEKAFELFKNEPNSVKVFDLIRAEIDSALYSQGFDEFFAGSDDSTASYCGMSFKKDQLLYHCR